MSNQRTIQATSTDIRSESTPAALRNIATRTHRLPWIFKTMMDDEWTEWTLRLKRGAEADDGANFIVPSDANSTDNSVIFVRNA